MPLKVPSTSGDPDTRYILPPTSPEGVEEPPPPPELFAAMYKALPALRMEILLEGRIQRVRSFPVIFPHNGVPAEPVEGARRNVLIGWVLNIALTLPVVVTPAPVVNVFEGNESPTEVTVPFVLLLPAADILRVPAVGVTVIFVPPETVLYSKPPPVCATPNI